MEVLSVHERHMYNEYKSLSVQPENLKLKAYRQIPSQRLRVKSELDRILKEIKSYYIVIPTVANETLADCFVNSYLSHFYDATDFLAVEAVLSYGVTDVISDDMDFLSDPRLTMHADG